MTIELLRTRHEERSRLVEKARLLLIADPRVVAAWLSGSLGRGDADDWSDIDLWVAVNGDLGAIQSAAQEHIRGLGTPLHMMEIPHNAPDGGLYIMAWYQGAGWPQHVDWTWQVASVATIPSDAQVLFDRVGLAPPAPLNASRSAEIAAERITWFWMMCPVAAKYIARRQPWEAIGMLSMLRRVPIEVAELLGTACSRIEGRQSGDATLPTDSEAQMDLLVLLASEVEVLMENVASQCFEIPSHLPSLVAEALSTVRAALDADRTDAGGSDDHVPASAAISRRYRST